MIEPIQIIALESIEVCNPRDRDEDGFAEIVQNIQDVGLKKPVVVTRRTRSDGSEFYLLVCGEGRLRAMRELGESTVAALVKDVSDEDALLMSLSENMARRHPEGRERIWPIQQLKNRGYTEAEIAAKTGLNFKWVQGMLILMSRGEPRLLEAVDKGEVPLAVAISIVGAGNDSQAAQAAMHEAYATGALSGHQLIAVRRLLEARQPTLGPRKVDEELTPSVLVKTLVGEVARKQTLVKKAASAQDRLALIAELIRRLMHDENFVNLLRAEGLDSMPGPLVERLHHLESSV